MVYITLSVYIKANVYVFVCLQNHYNKRVLGRVEYDSHYDALSWIKSYLSDRSQCVAIGMMTSEGKCLNFGVPQGSVLRPRKNCLYSKPVGAICSRHNLLYHCYADDTQVYMAIMPKKTWSDVAKKLEACLADISTWMSANMLKLNEEKTHYL